MPNTPIYGFPYPTPDDPVSQGASDIRALAEAVEALDAGIVYADGGPGSVIPDGGYIEIVNSGAHSYSGKPVTVEVFIPVLVVGNVSGNSVIVDLFDGASPFYRLTEVKNPGGGSFMSVPVLIRARIPLAAGSHTLGVQLYGFGGGAWTSAAAGPPLSPPSHLAVSYA